jgi:hypothetical protein
MDEDGMASIELMQKADGGDFFRSQVEAALQLLMEADVDGLIKASRQTVQPIQTTSYFPDFGGGILLHVRHLPGKSRDHAFLGLTLPTGYLCRMHVVLAGQLGQGQLARQGLERHFRLELR